MTQACQARAIPATMESGDCRCCLSTLWRLSLMQSGYKLQGDPEPSRKT